MYVRGIEAIKQYMPQDNSEISTNIKEERGQELTTTDAMSSAERYSEEWENLLKYLDNDPEYIREQAFEGDLKVSKFRSIYWSLLLRVLNPDYRNWKEQRGKQRKRYEKLKDEFIKDPHDIAVPDDNPLSQSEESVWNQYFSDQELFAVISQDVIRTFPGVDFFRKKIIQDAMCNILFYYAREHPYMCYRQGMHEILAPILFVLYGDQQSLLHFSEISQHQTSDLLLSVLDPNYLEADSYSLFSRLMSSIESYYRIKSFVQPPNECVASDGDSKPALGPGVEVISQLNSIREKILAKEDLHLHNYLLKLDIPLHIFGIRWLRLLFGREFPLLDLLVIWDAIFADSDHFDLPNYILVAMLIRIRDKLLLSDQTTCLTYLMRYPTNVDVNLILRHALHMIMPKRFERPSNAFVYFTVHKQTAGALRKTGANKSPAPQNSLKSSSSYETKEHFSKLQNSGTVSTADNLSKMKQQIGKLQTQNAVDSAAISRLRKDVPEESSAIAEGYSKNSQDLINLELKNAQTIISIARNKLQAYVTTIRGHLPGSSSKEMVQALDGIDELCSFLDVKFMFPIHATRPPIDEALEANEQVTLRKGHRKKDGNGDGISIAGVSSKQASTIGTSKENKKQHPTGANEDSFSQSAISVHAYVRPEEHTSLSPSHLLGGVREIELLTIVPSECVVEPVDVSQPKTEWNHADASQCAMNMKSPKIQHSK
ncbi:TBC1 domain family member 5 isoform X1 [Rhagoletis pomonella]|uniref:TBC1 domain family member 5 isoform X1 n=1 Tax=Rhagoletis pomonella TaxID=28610 RepID=UPI0017857156|nr:TBC1 domain family member 5 isoform X1 [Rhagoletis pomonella]